MVQMFQNRYKNSCKFWMNGNKKSFYLRDLFHSSSKIWMLRPLRVKFILPLNPIFVGVVTSSY
jgi:hypothetical protein